MKLLDIPRIGVSVAVCVFTALNSAGQQPSPVDLTEVSLEDLMNMRVTSVSKREQKISRAGAAVYVITQDDIRRSGANNVPDLLRMAPGVHVARMDSNAWAISIRGFNDLYADKVLVLIDGRSVYNPLFSGVYWDAQDVVLENIERIEVIRGPGDGMGSQRRQWRHQYHFQKLESHRGRSGHGRLGLEDFGGRRDAVRRGHRCPGNLPCVRQVFQRRPLRVPRRLARRRWLARLARRFPVRLGPVTPGYDDGPGGVPEDGVRPDDQYSVFQGASFASYVQRAVRRRGANLLGRWNHTLAERLRDVTANLR